MAAPGAGGLGTASGRIVINTDSVREAVQYVKQASQTIQASLSQVNRQGISSAPVSGVKQAIESAQRVATKAHETEAVGVQRVTEAYQRKIDITALANQVQIAGIQQAIEGFRAESQAAADAARAQAQQNAPIAQRIALGNRIRQGLEQEASLVAQIRRDMEATASGQRTKGRTTPTFLQFSAFPIAQIATGANLPGVAAGAMQVGAFAGIADAIITFETQIKTMGESLQGVGGIFGRVASAGSAVAVAMGATAGGLVASMGAVLAVTASVAAPLLAFAAIMGEINRRAEEARAAGEAYAKAQMDVNQLIASGATSNDAQKQIDNLTAIQTLNAQSIEGLSRLSKEYDDNLNTTLRFSSASSQELEQIRARIMQEASEILGQPVDSIETINAALEQFTSRNTELETSINRLNNAIGIGAFSTNDAAAAQQEYDDAQRQLADHRFQTELQFGQMSLEQLDQRIAAAQTEQALIDQRTADVSSLSAEERKAYGLRYTQLSTELEIAERLRSEAWAREYAARQQAQFVQGLQTQIQLEQQYADMSAQSIQDRIDAIQREYRSTERTFQNNANSLTEAQRLVFEERMAQLQMELDFARTQLPGAFIRDTINAANELFDSLVDAGENFARQTRRITEDRSIAAYQQMADRILSAGREIEDFLRGRAWRTEDFNRELAEAEAEFYENQQEVEQNFREEQIEAERDFREQIERIQRESRISILESAANLDARAVYQQQRRRDEQIREATRNYERERREREEAHEEERRDAEEQYRRQRERRIEEFNRQIAREDIERQIRLQRQEQDYAIQEQRQRDAFALQDRRRLEDYNKQLADLISHNSQTNGILSSGLAAARLLYQGFVNGIQQDTLALLGSGTTTDTTSTFGEFADAVTQQTPPFAPASALPTTSGALTAPIVNNFAPGSLVLGDIGKYSLPELQGHFDTWLYEFFTEGAQRVGVS